MPLGATGKVALDADLVETQYIIEIDNRLGFLADPTSGAQATPSFIDDDNIASATIVSLTTNTAIFSALHHYKKALFLADLLDIV